MKALIIIAHGSKKPLSNEEFLDFVSSLEKENTSHDITLPAFLELCEPSIEESTKQAIEKGTSQIYYYPYFLNSGKHIQIDIPTIIKKLEAIYPNAVLTLLNHFGKSLGIKDIVLKDIK